MAHVIQPISRLLVANRGEIARRINRTARAMGISTVAIYADGDANAPFVLEADTAIALGGKSTGETYLDVAKVLDAAKRSGADAIHPGYGFLSENQAFAQAVIDAGVKWLGPSPEVIGLMGDKLSAKRLMDEAGVPTLPGVEITEATDIVAAAADIGYPVLVKASAGGGGRGMRLVEAAEGLEAAISTARSEAENAFGSGELILEKAIDFESADNQPVDLVFVLLAPEKNNGSDHLKALAMISRCFKDKNTRSKLRLTKNIESVFAILTEKEDSKAA